ncbi:hypothetical protein NCS57_00268400 [Fusarium keratoplasticum]|uniref:Uncharacterized protein n=1 Tax=Fusarium keratoplasticum TaxID=1328300 RepID=A0ACC0RAR7_9HYPO|nr:hypothetical protein NCS57_00268400 [Fusarium keratoplasticum]KAI8679893.1 hypothetical protein NCS57_00268400 [Fusarium keratoplasticum]
MAEDSSNHDEGFGLPPAPTIAPEFSAEWLDLEHPESVSAIEAVILSRLHFIAAQNQHIMLQLKNLRLTNYRTQSRRGSMSSTATSTEGGGDGNIAPIPGARAQEAFDELRTGELQVILTALHNPFVTINNKKLYVQRTINANTDAQTFIEHITQVIKEKQANPEGQEADVAEHHEKLLGYLDNLTLGLKTDLYIELNKTKKKRDSPKGKGKAKVKKSSSPVFAPTDDSGSGSSRVKGEQSE